MTPPPSSTTVSSPDPPHVRAGWPPRLADLPAPPPGRTGWPWTEAPPPVAERKSNGDAWPRITVVTPSYEQGAFLEETIRSVLLQGYPNLEYIVIDGGSRDGSVEIIRNYAPWLAYWTSEPDGGQSHAINKGLARSTGAIQAWLNSDDTYYPGVLRTVALAMASRSCDLLIGGMDKVRAYPDRIEFVRRSSPNRGAPFHRRAILAGGRRATFHFIQPPMFWQREIWERTGGLDERYRYAMDTEWCNRALAAGASVGTIDMALARFTLHAGSKSQDYRDRQLAEHALMYLRLARLQGFRPIPCVLAGISPARRALALRARGLRDEGRTARAFILRTGGRAMGLLDRAIGVLDRAVVASRPSRGRAA